ncbi:hypothetical protein [Phaeacidiphilus oryzae]|uniref:hypothetical protein n=1 Tax=Phaeacidiphilus oryzae TaxID=348818 RepID=UPI00056586CE|nr:hypothetical protein [Phaeacidiphilus oryzae]
MRITDSTDLPDALASGALPVLAQWAALVIPLLTLLTLAVRAAVWKDRLMRRLDEYEARDSGRDAGRAAEGAPGPRRNQLRRPPGAGPRTVPVAAAVAPLALLTGLLMELTRRHRLRTHGHRLARLHPSGRIGPRPYLRPDRWRRHPHVL